MERETVKWGGAANLTWSDWQHVCRLQGWRKALCELWEHEVEGERLHCRMLEGKRGERWGGRWTLEGQEKDGGERKREAVEQKEQRGSSLRMGGCRIDRDMAGQDRFSTFFQSISRTVDLPRSLNYWMEYIFSFINEFRVYRREDQQRECDSKTWITGGNPRFIVLNVCVTALISSCCRA